MTVLRKSTWIAIVACLGASTACGRIGFEQSASLAYDGGPIAPRSDAGASSLQYDDAGRLINTNVAVPTDQVVPGTIASSTAQSNGAASNGASSGLDIDVSNTGDYVAFASSASNLIVGDTNDAVDVFVLATTAQRIVRLSPQGAPPNGASGFFPAGTPKNNGVFDDETNAGPSISNDGSVVAFASVASNWFTGDNNARADVIVATRGTDGNVQSVVAASLSASGEHANGASWAPALSGDGNTVAFVSEATNLVANDANGVDDVFVRNLSGNTIARIARQDGVALNGASRQPSVSADGQLVAFITDATNVSGVATYPSYGKVVLWNAVDQSLTVIGVNLSGDLADRSCAYPRISGDGRFVVFITSAGNLGTDDNRLLDVYRYEISTGDVQLVSVDRNGNAAVAFRNAPDISADGRFIVFGSSSGAIVENDFNMVGDIFVRDMQMLTTRIVSVSPDLHVANNLSRPRAMSPDATSIAFTSDASNLVTGDTNGLADVFVMRGISW